MHRLLYHPSLPGLQFFLLFIFILIAAVQAQEIVNNTSPILPVSTCSTLRRRIFSPKNAADVRPDDIKVVASLGDSLMTGFGANGVSGTIFDKMNLYEARDISFTTGGREGFMTLSNAFAYYSGSSLGASHGTRPSSLCASAYCPFDIHVPEVDQLNGAINLAWAKNLDEELSYLILRMKALMGRQFTKDWKLIVIQIGDNDICFSCFTTLYEQFLTPDIYSGYLDRVIERIRLEIPKAIVNVVGPMKQTEILQRTEGQEYCDPFDSLLLNGIVIGGIGCPCALDKEDWPQIDSLVYQYDEKIKALVKKYKDLTSDSFGIMYTPANFNISGWPITRFSKLDCFHPSIEGHGWLATAIWNTLFMKRDEMPSQFSDSFGDEVHCPTESDRLQLG